jgi:hypothetical protein
MMLGAYVPRWVRVSDSDGQFRAITFTINRAGPSYAGRLPPETIIERLMTCHGRMGPGIEYLLHTAEALRECGIADRHLQQLCDLAHAMKARLIPLAWRRALERLVCAQITPLAERQVAQHHLCRCGCAQADHFRPTSSHMRRIWRFLPWRKMKRS